MDGLFLVNKPAGMGSTHVTNHIKWLIKQVTTLPHEGKKTKNMPCVALAKQGRIKVGHGGTLDPFATGILPIAVGKATKLLTPLLDAPKTYTFTLQFGTATTTADNTGITTSTSTHFPTPHQIKAILPRFTGQITQIPPAFSALKVNGQRAYALARNGQNVQLEPRQITIHSLTLLETAPTAARFQASVSKGTYIRTLGEDIAKALGTVGHLTQLCRTAHGPFLLEKCVDLQTLDNALQTGQWEPYLVPLSTLTALLAGQSPDVEPSKREPVRSHIHDQNL